MRGRVFLPRDGSEDAGDDASVVGADIVVAVDPADGPLEVLDELGTVLLLALHAEAAALAVLGSADADCCLRHGLHDRTPVPPMPQ